MRAEIERLRAARAEREGVLAEVEREGSTDGVTGLGNRRRFQQLMPGLFAQTQASMASLAIVALELDGVARYRDEQGSPALARLLLSVVGDWQRRLRVQDVLLRVDDDRFVLVLPGCSTANAARVGRRLTSDASDVVRCAVGLALWDGAEDAEALLERAFAAMGTVEDPGEALGVPG
jgi:diguanylate cyclase (GGDEF)-like protein